jgi:hypothetical protein
MSSAYVSFSFICTFSGFLQILIDFLESNCDRSVVYSSATCLITWDNCFNNTVVPANAYNKRVSVCFVLFMVLEKKVWFA